MLTVGAQPEANIAADSLVIAENFAQHKAEDEDNDIPYYDKRKNARADRAVGRAEANFVFFSPERAPLGHKAQAQREHKQRADNGGGIAGCAVAAACAPERKHRCKRGRAERGY